MTFGEKLQKLRAREGISQDRLAELLDVSRQAVSKWERDEAMPEAEKVIRISNYFRVTTDYLLKDGPEQFPSVRRRLPDLEGWYREKGYQLGWLLAAWGIWQTLRTMYLLFFQAGWWFRVRMFLTYPCTGAVLAAVGILAAVLGRKRAGALRWYHWGWLPVFWGALELARVGLLLILAAVPPENVFFALDGTVWEAYGPHLLLALLAAAAGLAVFCAGKRHAARREAKSQT